MANHESDIKTCPKCGALITPQLTRCRQCGEYLHGTRLEGLIFEHLLPEQLAASPGTGLLALLIVFYYVGMAAVAGIESAVAYSGYSLQQLGATHGPAILLGQYWRFVTSIFGHHDLLHLAMNLYCLAQVGPAVEQLFDRKKMMLIYLVAGVSSMAVSHVWYVHVTNGLMTTSAGASGAVCGMIGAALVGARRDGDQARFLFMRRWAIYMVIWGLMVPGINNAAHFGGFAVGAGLAYLVPLGLAQTVVVQRALSVAMLLLLVVVGGSTYAMLDNLRGFPGRLANDAAPRSLFMWTVEEGTPWGRSSQVELWEECVKHGRAGDTGDEALHACELAIRAVPYDSTPYASLAEMYLARGDTQRAERLIHLARRVRGLRP